LGTVYDAEQIARTTVKETALQEAGNANLQAHKYQPIAALSDDARKTVRETLEPMETSLNVNPAGASAGIAYDPNDIAKTTTKETVADAAREFGNVDSVNSLRGGYTVAVAEARVTHKQTLADIEYYGQPAAEGGDGYRVTNAEAKATQKQVLSDIEYFGTSGSIEGKKPSQQEQYDNAVVRSQQEQLLDGRAPVQQGPKLASGADALNACDNNDKRQLLKTVDEFVSLERTPAQLTTGGDVPSCLTRERHAYKDLGRLDQELLAQLVQGESNDLSISVTQRAGRGEDAADADDDV
jgi:hypothetical protein